MRWPIFQTPKKACLGLEISHTHIQLVYLVLESAQVSIHKAATVEISVQPKETLVNATLRVIKQLVRNSNRPYRDVISALSDTDCLSFETSLDQTSTDWKAHALVAAAPYVPIPLDTLYFDFQLYKAVDTHKVLSVFCRKQVVNERLTLIKDSGLRLIALEPRSHALERAFHYWYEVETYPPCWACVAISDSSLTLLLWSHHTVLGSFSDTLESPDSLLGIITQVQQCLMQLLGSHTINSLEGLWVVGDHTLCRSIEEDARKRLGLDNHPPTKWRDTGITLPKDDWNPFYVAFGLALRYFNVSDTC